MKIIQIETGTDYTENAYAVFNRDECILIDPGKNETRIASILADNNVRCTAILLTHGHYDHIGAAKYFQNKGASVSIHRADAPMLSSNVRSLALALGGKLEPFQADTLLSGGETLHLANLTIKVLHTPGHTPGGACYIIGKNIFSGDTLFYEDVGRSDFPGGSGEQLSRSIREKLYALTGDYNVYPGHGEATTLAHERTHNRYVTAGDSYGI